MKENTFQNEFLKIARNRVPSSSFFTGLELNFEEGKQERRKNNVMPDVKFDIIQFDEHGKFHLWELKLIDSPELKTGKFFGQMMLYTYLFETSDTKKLIVQIDRACKRQAIDSKEILAKLVDLENAEFESWNLCVCGGSEAALDVGMNPIIWTYWVMADLYFRHEAASKLVMWHLYEALENQFDLRELLDGN
jgi:hypothetical protein